MKLPVLQLIQPPKESHLLREADPLFVRELRGRSRIARTSPLVLNCPLQHMHIKRVVYVFTQGILRTYLRQKKVPIMSQVQGWSIQDLGH